MAARPGCVVPNGPNAVETALVLWEKILDPNIDLVAVETKALDEMMRGKTFLMVCQALGATLEHCGLLEDGFRLSGDPETETIEITAGDKKIVIVPPMVDAGVQPTHSFSGKATIN